MVQEILSLNEFKQRFDPIFSRIFDTYITRVPLFVIDEDASALLTHAKVLSMAGGKRIRPYVAYLMFHTVSKNDDEHIFPLLAALELFHVFALIHDDIIDQGILRHGVLTLHKFAALPAADRTNSTKHRAEGLAMLVGDLLFSWSKDLFARESLLHGHTDAHNLFNDMAYAAVLGQMLDIQLMRDPNPTEERVLQKTLLKTAQYTFIYPMRIGASIANVQYSPTWCDDFGTAIGLAFQLQDDMLDIVGNQEITGKHSLQDAIDGQHTVFTAYIRYHATESERELLDTLLRTPGTLAEGALVQELFEKTGALHHGRTMIGKALSDARSALAAQSMSDHARAAWESLILLVEQRAS